MNNQKLLSIIAFFILMPMIVQGDTGKETATEIIQNNISPWLKNSKEKNLVQCVSDELVISQIENKIFTPLANAIKNKNNNELQNLLPSEISGLAILSKPSKEMDGISEFSWSAKSDSLSNHVAKFDTIEFVELRIADFSIDPDNRNTDGTFSKVNALLRLDIRGKQNNKLTQEKGLVQAALTKINDNWKIQSMKALNGKIMVQNRAPAFKEITKESGLSVAQIYRRTEAIRRGGYALSVHDINNDGIQDIFIGMRGSPEVWLGKGDGTFTKMENNPFQEEKYLKSAVFADFNNNSNPSVVFTRYIDHKNFPIKNNRTPDLDVAIYDSKDGNYFLTKNKINGRASLREPMPLSIADFNNDGYLDFYVGYPGRQDFSQLGKSEQYPLNSVQGLYLNNKKGGFQDFTEALIKWNNDADYEGRLFPHSALSADFDQDGNQDLFVADDRGNLSPYFSNKGNRNFVESSKEFSLSNHGFSMSLATGDIENRGLTDIALTNVYLNEFARIKSTCMRHFAYLPHQLDEGLRIFEAQKNNRFIEKTSEVLLDYPGDAPAGLNFVDYNNDGLMDLYVANGLWSGTQKGQNLNSFFTSLVDITRDSFYSLRSADSLRFMDILSSFKGTIDNYTKATSIANGDERPSLGGYQRNRLYRNNGDGTYTDVAFLEGADSMADGYVVAKADLNNDGKMDLVLRNADPGTDDYSFPVVQIYKNQYEGKNRSATFSFQGTKSNHNGYGLFAKATIGGKTQIQHLSANSGSMQEQALLQFGLGKHSVIEKLAVHWPSGSVQTFKNVKPGHHIVKENADQLDLKLGVEKPAQNKKSAAKSAPKKVN